MIHEQNRLENRKREKNALGEEAEMKNWQKKWMIITGFICVMGMYLLRKDGMTLQSAGRFFPFQEAQDAAEAWYFPNIIFSQKNQQVDLQACLASQIMKMIPLGNYVVQMQKEENESEDTETYELLLKKEAADETAVDSDGNLIGQDTSQETAQTIIENENLSLDKLKNFDYLVSNFYTVDSVTYLEEGDLNAEQMLAKDLTIDTKTDGPKILIFHTHSQESFVDSDGTTDTSIVGIGRYLTGILSEQYGINTLHHEGVYDLINGKLDRSEAYELAEPNIRQILNENPSIEVVIDLHRDGVKETTHLATEINGKSTAQIMFFNGLCRTRTNGDLSSMLNPYIQDNLAFSLQMKIDAEKKYPGFTRRNYLKGYKYNMDLAPKMLLIEAGAQTNTVEEMKNAMEPLADILNDVLIKK